MGNAALRAYLNTAGLAGAEGTTLMLDTGSGKGTGVDMGVDVGNGATGSGAGAAGGRGM